MRKIKKFLRSVMQIKEKESFGDGMLRHFYHFKKKFPHKRISILEFEKYLINIGVKKGDTIIVHSAWRAMYMIDAKPEEIVDKIIEVIGSSGTLLMPCYGNEEGEFNVEKTNSAAGVLSEILRKKTGSLRSVFPKFSMIAYGKNANEIIKDHINSHYQFDKSSPYNKAMRLYDAKILLIGLGKKPHKITIFHCASYDSRTNNAFYENCYTIKKVAKIITNDGEIDKEYIDRKPNYQNDKKCFRRLFDKVKKNQVCIHGLNMILFDSKNAYNVAKKFCDNDGKIYRV